MLRHHSGTSNAIVLQNEMRSRATLHLCCCSEAVQLHPILSSSLLSLVTRLVGICRPEYCNLAHAQMAAARTHAATALTAARVAGLTLLKAVAEDGAGAGAAAVAELVVAAVGVGVDVGVVAGAAAGVAGTAVGAALTASETGGGGLSDGPEEAVTSGGGDAGAEAAATGGGGDAGLLLRAAPTELGGGGCRCVVGPGTEMGITIGDDAATGRGVGAATGFGATGMAVAGTAVGAAIGVGVAGTASGLGATGTGVGEAGAETGTGVGDGAGPGVRGTHQRGEGCSRWYQPYKWSGAVSHGAAAGETTQTGVGLT